jgi:hypothetical protein
MKTIAFCLIAAIASFAVQPTATFSIKHAEAPNGYHSTTLCIPEVNYCSKPSLYKQIGNKTIDEYGNVIDIEEKSSDMIIEACMHTDAYVSLNGRIIDCGKMQAVELSPFIGTFTKLYEAFVHDNGGKAGNFEEIGFVNNQEKDFFEVAEIKYGAIFTLKSDIHECKKGAKWIIIGKPSPDNVLWSLTEPSNAMCKTFITDNLKAHFNSRVNLK